MINFKRIQVIVIDVDGTLTDGIYQFSDTNSPGGITKSFYTRDFYAMEQALKEGIEIIIITQSTDDCIRIRLDRIKDRSRSEIWGDAFSENRIKLFEGADDKCDRLDTVFFSDCTSEPSWDNVAYIGDAENDIEPMKRAYYTGCPFDAVRGARENSNYLSKYPGGKGCVYDFIMYILEQRKKDENT